jgi:hypothetical protein
MSYSQDDIIAMKVHEMVTPKIEHFMDSVSKEVHDMHLEMKQNREFDSAMIAQFNDVKGDVVAMEETKTKVDKLHTLFCENGYMEKFNKLVDDWNQYKSRDRMLTCPVADDVKQILDERKEEKRQADARRNGELKTRREDKWKIVSSVLAGAGWVTLITKLVGLW